MRRGIKASLSRSVRALVACAVAAVALGFPGRAAAYERIRVYDLDYIHRTYYFISDHPLRWDRASLRVFFDDAIASDNISEVRGIARLDPTADTLGTGQPGSNPQIQGSFGVLTQGVDYDLIYPYTIGDGPPFAELPVIQFRTPLPTYGTIGITYVEEVGGHAVAVGNPDPFAVDVALGKPAGFYLLKLIHPPYDLIPELPGGRYDHNSPWYPALQYQLRNFYSLGKRNISREELTLKIRRLDAAYAIDPDTFQGQPFLELLGLDQHGPTVDSPPDGKVDDNFIDRENGIIFFPDLHPFAPDTACTALCLDDLARNPLRSCNDPGCIGNPYVYDVKNPDPENQARFYIEAVIAPPDAPQILRQNRPNPFRVSTTIEFDTPRDATVLVSIFDIQGRLIRRRIWENAPVGVNSFYWDGRDWRGRLVPSGVYVCRMQSGALTRTKRMVLTR